nr:hypothetical protein HK105_000966 [Polyrhizophydium stewartii]
MVLLPALEVDIEGDAVASAGGIKPLLAAVPSYVLFRPWTLLTAGFVETRLVFFLINISALLFMGRYFENIWGSREFAKYAVIVTVSTYTATTLMLYVGYAATLDLSFLFGTQANGLGGLLCGLVVAFKQAVPEHTIVLLRLQLPSIIFVIHLVLFLLGLIHVSFFIETFGMVASWIYIRFYKMQDGIRGDRSETFSFTSFFPDAMQPVLKPISTVVYRFMVKYRLLPPLPGRPLLADIESPAPGQMPPALPLSGEISDADRRRCESLRMGRRLSSG